jgi:ATP phosphoribosyltransferase
LTKPCRCWAAGIEVLEDPEKSRKLILPTNQPDVRVVLVRATDVPTYVQYGGADMGVTGKDTLIEHGGAGPVPAAGPANRQVPHERGGAPTLTTQAAVKAGLAPDGGHQIHHHRARILRRQGRARGPDQALRQHGTGAADRAGDAIVDLVSTGNTLKANHLVEVEHIMDISSRLVVNQAALKLKQAPIRASSTPLPAVADGE